jgi:hypothetical protein
MLFEIKHTLIKTILTYYSELSEYLRNIKRATTNNSKILLQSNNMKTKLIFSTLLMEAFIKEKVGDKFVLKMMNLSLKSESH